MLELLGMDEPRKRIAAMISGLDIRDRRGHPLLGLHPTSTCSRRMAQRCSLCCTTPGRAS